MGNGMPRSGDERWWRICRELEAQQRELHGLGDRCSVWSRAIEHVDPELADALRGVSEAALASRRVRITGDAPVSIGALRV